MYSVEQPSDQRLDQKVDERMTENHLPGQYLDIALAAGQYLDIALAAGQYLDIALEAGQYKIYCPAKAFDPPTQSGIYVHIQSLSVYKAVYALANYITH